MADKRLIQRELQKININSRSREKNLNEMNAIVDKFHGQMVEVTDREFQRAIDHYSIQNPWFPSLKEVLDTVALIRRQDKLKDEKKYLPPPPKTAEERAEIKRQCERVRKNISHRWE